MQSALKIVSRRIIQLVGCTPHNNIRPSGKACDQRSCGFKTISIHFEFVSENLDLDLSGSRKGDAEVLALNPCKLFSHTFRQ